MEKKNVLIKSLTGGLYCKGMYNQTAYHRFTAIYEHVNITAFKVLRLYYFLMCIRPSTKIEKMNISVFNALF